MDPFLTVFLIIPPAALVARELGRLKLPLGLVFLIYVPAGWLLLSLRVQWHFAVLDQLARNNPNPSAEVLTKLQHEGGTMVFALYLGWAMAAVYFGICLGLIKIASYLIRRRA
jgi:hypothetical protein